MFWVVDFPLARAFPLPPHLKDVYPIPESVMQDERKDYPLRRREIEPNWLPTWASAPDDEPAPSVHPPSVPPPSIPAPEADAVPSTSTSFLPEVQAYLNSHATVTPLADEFHKTHGPIMKTPGVNEMLSAILGPLTAPSGPTPPAPDLATHWIFHPAIRGIRLTARDTRTHAEFGEKSNVAAEVDFANVLQVTRRGKRGLEVLTTEDIRYLQPACLS